MYMNSKYLLIKSQAVTNYVYRLACLNQPDYAYIAYILLKPIVNILFLTGTKVMLLLSAKPIKKSCNWNITFVYENACTTNYN